MGCLPQDRSEPNNNIPAVNRHSSRSLSPVERALLQLEVGRENVDRQTNKTTRPFQPSAAILPRESVQEPDDRRRFPRRTSQCGVIVHPYKNGEPINRQQTAWTLHSSRLKGELIEISFSGVAFWLPCPLEPLSRAMLRITHPRLDDGLDVAVKVLRSSSMDQGRWEIACRLEERLTLAQIQAVSRHLSLCDVV